MTSEDVAQASVAVDVAMAEKHRTACRLIRASGMADFLNWLCEHYVLAQRDVDGELFEMSVSRQKIFEDYFEIDMAAVERYRRRLLDEVRR